MPGSIISEYHATPRPITPMRQLLRRTVRCCDEPGAFLRLRDERLLGLLLPPLLLLGVPRLLISTSPQQRENDLETRIKAFSWCLVRHGAGLERGGDAAAVWSSKLGPRSSGSRDNKDLRLILLLHRRPDQRAMASAAERRTTRLL
jgi:hypothetical protein